MKLDRNTVRSLSEMSDDRLWRTLHLFASAMGLELPPKMRGKLRYEAIRQTLSALTDEDIARANEIMEIYKYHKSRRAGGGYR